MDKEKMLEFTLEEYGYRLDDLIYPANGLKMAISEAMKRYAEQYHAERVVKKDILFLINSIRETEEPYIESIYTNGGCYKFHLYLKKFFPKCKLYINKNKNHVVTELDGKMYDITGEISSDVFKKEGFQKATSNDLKKAKSWSFTKYNMLFVGECPSCEEPIVV